MAEQICDLCNHSLVNNSHGLDQNDAYLDGENKLIHSGSCTYCRICNPRIFKEKPSGSDKTTTTNSNT